MPGTGVVGREAELASIDAFLSAAEGAFSALVLEGKPGIGKTTLWREAGQRAQERGALVLSCRPSAAEAKLSFAAIADLLSPVEKASFATLPPPQRDALEVALLRTSPSGGDPSARGVAAGVLTLVRELAASRTVVLAIDDVQWLDPPSRAAIEFTARRLGDEPVGLLCSLRIPGQGSPILRAVAEERLHRQVLGALSLAAIGQIIAARLGRSLPRPLLARINGACEGNPFYALEIARMLIERGVDHVPGAELPVPDELQALTVARIRRLPAESREAVLLASVLSAPDTQMVDARALAPAEEAGIVSVDRTGRIEFMHPLFASAAYSSVPSSHRRALHRRAAELVTDLEQRSRHLALAAQAPDPAVAEGLDEAAALASLRGAPDVAAELAELAAVQTPSQESEARAERLVGAARFHFDAGDPTHAEALAQEALELRPSQQVRALALQLGAQLSARRSNFSEAVKLAQAALDAAADDRLRAGIELDLLNCVLSLGDLVGAERHGRAAAAYAEAAGDNGMLADALAVLTMSEFLAGRGLDQKRLDRALSLEDPLMARSWIMRPRVIHGLLQLWTGELDGALENLGAVHTESIDRGLEGSAPMAAIYLAWAAVWRGRFAQAARWSEESRAAADLLEDPTTSGVALSASALVHAHDGRTDLARSEARQALALFERLQFRTGVIWPLWALGLAALSVGEYAEVDAALGPLAEQVAAMGTADPVLSMFLPDEIEALIALGELERAEAYLEPFGRHARELDRAWAAAAAARCRGALASARGEREAAFAAFERALSEHDRTQMPFERARTLLEAGRSYRRFKQRGRAREVLSTALNLFESTGAPQWSARTRAELGRLGGPGPGGHELTPTERRVAELAASGLSNQEVAERAFVSLKTVEANLTRVYRKLGVRSRVELANALRGSEAAPAESVEGSRST